VRAAEVLMGHATLEHVPQGHEHGVLHGDDRLFGAAGGLSCGGRARGSSSSWSGPPPRPPLAGWPAARWRPCRWGWAAVCPRSRGCQDTAAPRTRSAPRWGTGPCPRPSRRASPTRAFSSPSRTAAIATTSGPASGGECHRTSPHLRGRAGGDRAFHLGSVSIVLANGEGGAHDPGL
jgi:hypothetical protein